MRGYLFVLILVIGGFLFGRFFDKIKKQIKKFKLKPNLGLILMVVVASLFLGILIGRGTKVLKNISQDISDTSKVKLRVATPRPGKILVLSNFESEVDFKRWKTRKSTFKQTSKHVTEGRYAGEMVFFGRVECSNILMEDFLEDNPSFGNWTGFNQIRFDIYNTSDNTERLILKIKDEAGKSWQRNMFFAPKQNTEIKIYIDELKDMINASQIRQFNFFRWEPKNEVTFYMDNLRLIPGGIEEKKEESKGEDDKFLFDEQGDFGIGVETAIDKVFLEPDKFKGKAQDSIEISLARNEYESTQLVIYAKKRLENVRIEKNDLIANINGKEVRFDKNNIRFYIVGYVKTKRPGYNVSYVGWWPDPLEEKNSFDIRENNIQPIWVEIFAPSGTLAGEYSGEINIKFENAESKNIKLKVKVWNFSLPKETHLKTAFDFYENRLRRIYPQEETESIEEYNRRIYELKTKYYLDMIKHRIMPIFNFDLSNGFVIKDIQFYVNQGLSNFAIGRFGGSFDNNWPEDPEKLSKLIDIYRAYAQILKLNNLIDMAYIYTYDEPKFGDSYVDMVTKMIHQASPELKNMVCLHNLANPDKYPRWGDDIDIWCLRNVVFNEKIAKKYGDKEFWIYVSGPEPPYPTLVIDYPAIAYRIIPWMCWKYGIKGYLYWCINFWQDNPWKNPMNTKWEQNGNGFLYYPGEDGPVASIRLKVSRDGLEDYEYFYLLSQKIQAIRDKNLEGINQKLINRAQELLNIDESIISSMADYTKDPEVIYNRRGEIAELIEELDKILSN